MDGLFGSKQFDFSRSLLGGCSPMTELCNSTYLSKKDNLKEKRKEDVFYFLFFSFCSFIFYFLYDLSSTYMLSNCMSKSMAGLTFSGIIFEL
jgi:hypothetical protein